MSQDQKELLRRLDTLNKNIEILSKVVAVSVGKEALFKDKKQKEQIAFLSKLGLPRNIVASIVVTTPLTVSVTKSQRKKKQKKTGSAKPNIETPAEKGLEKAS